MPSPNVCRQPRRWWRADQWTAAVLPFVLTLLAVGCVDSPVDPSGNPGEYKMKIDGVKATYDASQNKAILTWNGLDRSKVGFDFYRIYRTTRTIVVADADSSVEKPDTSAQYFTSTGPRRKVGPDRSSFVDILGLANTVYAYGIRAVRVEGTDTVEGVMSNIATCTVGVEISFNINSGDVFTITDQARLVVNDPAGLVDSVVFTQHYQQYLTGDSGMVEVDFEDPANPPPADTVGSLIAAGYLRSSGKLASGVELTRVPRFDSRDTLNAARAYQLTGQRTFPWRLRQGNGEKVVWAKMFKKNGEVDTLRDGIRIAPFGNNGYLRIKLRNETAAGEETMRELPGVDNAYIIYKPWVKFSISIFADTTISRDFEYWLVFSDSTNSVDPKINARNAWLETMPRKGRLTGEGAGHDDTHVYRYMLDPDSAEGKENLSRLRRTFNYPNDPRVDQLAFKLRGTEPYNEIAVPGSYWGPSPKRWDITKRDYVDIQEEITGSAHSNYDEIVKMQRTFIYDFGKKEFWIFARFRGKYFNDVRMAASIGDRLDIPQHDPNLMQGYMDLYPPKVNIDAESPLWITNGHQLTQSFGYALAQTGSVTDDGEAKVEAVELVVAQWPQSRSWDNKTTPYTLTLEQLQSYRHMVYPFPIPVPDVTISDVAWRDIDASDWPTGKYVMALVTRDEFGNEGFAPMKYLTSEESTNPWIATVLTGK